MRAAGGTPGAGLRPFIALSALLVLVGIAAFVIGIVGDQADRVWQAYLINFLFWTGLSAGTVLFSAVLVMTNAHWGRPVKRLAEAPGAFLPVAFVLFWVLYFGREELFPWIHEPLPHKAWWLNVGGLFTRDGLGLLILAVLAVALIYHSVQGDLKVIAAKRGEGSPESLDPAPNHHAQAILSPIFAVAYALILSLIAVDLIMTLDPHWVSTLFGAYYFIGSFYTGLAAVIVLTVLSLRGLGLKEVIGSSILHDLGKLLFGFCIVTGDFFYVQFLVIWYGNLPEETKFVILRIRGTPWEPLAWAVLVVCFVLPFLILLRRGLKMRPYFMLTLSGALLVGMWFERLLLVAPSLWRGEHLPLGPIEVLISAGFLGMVALCTLLFIRRFPVLPISDPLLMEGLKRGAH